MEVRVDLDLSFVVEVPVDSALSYSIVPVDLDLSYVGEAPVDLDLSYVAGVLVDLAL